jgi:HSP20 family protein
MPAGAGFLYQECYWGGFSRTIVLPTEVKSELARAEYKYGVLTIRLPKHRHDSQIQIDVIE